MTNHPNAALLVQLFTALNRRDADGVAACYGRDATFSDIAFDLHGQDAIRDMWRMICAGDIRSEFEVVCADDERGQVAVIDHYTFTDTGRAVRNVIDSRFRFAKGLVLQHRHECDPRAWAAMAIGGAAGFAAGRLAPLRRFKARKKLQAFLRAHPMAT